MNKVELMYEMRTNAAKEMARCDAAVAEVSAWADEPFTKMAPPDLVLGNILCWHDSNGKYLATMQIYGGGAYVTRYRRGPSQGSKDFDDWALAIAWVRDHLESMNYLDRTACEAPPSRGEAMSNTRCWPARRSWWCWCC